MRLPSKHLGWFLLAVFFVRAVHLMLLGTVGTGMNQAMAVEAKAVLTCGLGNAFTEKPPVAVLLLSVVSYVLGMVPGDAIYVVNLLVHLLFAVAFWVWLHALELRPATRQLSLLVFLGLPLLNGYDGFDNYPTILAATAFLLIAAWLPRPARTRMSMSQSGFAMMGDRSESPHPCPPDGSRSGPEAWSHRMSQPVQERGGQYGTAGRLHATLCTGVRLAVLSWFIMLVRIEYLVLLPWYLVLNGLLAWFVKRALPSRDDCRAAAVVCGSLCMGALTTMAFRYADAGDFALAPNTYGCVTFLQGTPEAWLEPQDQGDWGRYHRGVQYFGDPAECGYSLFRMMSAHPVRTVQKALLNVPLWLFHLGRRHVVVPLPLAAIAAFGGIVFARGRSTGPGWQPLLRLLATILMTLPLVVTSVLAEYMTPAFVAVVVLAAHGLRWWVWRLTTWVRRCATGAVAYRLVWYSTVAAYFVIMEWCYFRGGGNLPDATDLRPVAEAIDQLGSPTAGRLILLDPPSENAEMFSRTDIRNRWLTYQWLRQSNGPARAPTLSVPDPCELAELPAARALSVDRAAVYFPSGAPPEVRQERLRAWQRVGFTLKESTDSRPDARGGTYTIFLLERRAERPGRGRRRA